MLFSDSMRILMTGGTGLIGTGAIPRLLEQGHAVRLLARHANEDAKRWEGVEAVQGDVSDASTIRGAADGCDAVLHIAGIAKEDPPELTFEKVNVGGTRNILAEAERANVRRFLFVSSLGANTGSSDYHKSKAAAEALVEQSRLAWTIVRPGSVYGPGDEVISTMLKMFRALPAVPVIDDGNQEFQPVWYEDLGRALAKILERDDLSQRTLELAGREITSMNNLLERFREITGRKPLRVPVPETIASLSSRLASIAVDLPIDDEKLTMLREKNVLEAQNGFDALNLETTPLDDGLRFLADSLPEVMPHDGVGALERKRFWADIRGSRHTTVSLMTLFRERLNEMMPLEFSAEPGTSADVEPGKTLTLHLPLRGNSQVRAEIVEPTRVVFVTIEGHPLAGMVQFFTEDTAGGVRFNIEIFARASNPIDWLAVHTVGKVAQSSNWRAVVQRVIDASTGTSDGVHQEAQRLDDEEATRVEERIKTIVANRERAENRV